jgi:hypothetical protein
MIALLAPAALLGLIGLVVPIVAHLVSRRAGPVKRVGSVRWMQDSLALRARSLRLRELWLLLLRLTIVSLLVLVLAGPYRRRPGVVHAEWWALVGPELLTSPTAVTNAVLDSLQRTGTETRLLTPGLPRWAGGRYDPGRSPPAAAADYWSLLREAATRAPAGTRFLLLTSDRADHFPGARPRVGAEVQWRFLPAGDPASSKSIAGTRPARRVDIYVGKGRGDDGRYLQAAFRIVAAQASEPATVALRSGAAPSPDGSPGSDAAASRWLVWLGPEPVPPTLDSIVAAGATLLADAGEDSVLDRESGLNALSVPVAGIRLHRRVVPRELGPGEAALWTDDFGDPMLAVRGRGKGLEYRFAARFHPEWTDLVLSPVFPRLIGGLWLGEKEGTGLRIAASQVVPSPARRDLAPEPAMPLPRPDLALSLWLLVVLAFAIERAVALQWSGKRR